MLPEPLPWERKEYFRDRNYERSLSSEFYHCPYAHQISGRGGYSEVMGIGGGGPRWRERYSHPNPEVDPYPYQYPSPRWASDFRGRTGPPGYAKQGSPHLYPEDGGHRFVQSHPNDRFLEDERYRSSSSGRHTRFNWKSRPSFNLKDKEGSLCKAAPSHNDPGRPNDVGDKQKSMDDVLTHNSSPHPNYSCDRSQPKDQTEENDSLDASVSSSQELERISSSVSNDCKTHNWTQSGRFSARSCIMGHLSSSRSIGVDCNEMKVEAQQGNDTLLPPSGDADNPVAATYAPAASETYTAPSEEIRCCKRRRLGWGEGLAKYENQKTEHTDGSMTKNDMVVCSNSGEQMHVLASNVIDKIPRASSLTECPSPARQFALSYSYSPVTKEKELMSGSIISDKTNLIVSSATKEKQLMTAGSLDHDKSNLSLPPAIEEKQLMTARSIDHDKGNLSLSPVAEEQQLKTDGSINHDKANLSVTPGFISQNHVEGSNFKLKNLDLEPFAINDLPQSDSLSAVDSDFGKSTAIDKLPSWKNDVLKAIELTESEINKLECQLKSVSIPEIVHNQPTYFSFLPVDCLLKPSHIQTTVSNITCQTASVEIVLDKKMACAEEVLAADVNYGGVDVSSGKGASSNPENQVQKPLTTEDFGYACLDANSNFEGLSGDKAADFSVFIGSQSNDVNPLSDEEDEDKLCEVILASNRDSAIGAAESFNKLLPANNCNSYIPLAIDNSVMIKARLLRRKLLLRFKERIVALKFRVFQHFWKQDVRLLSMRRFLVKSQKRTNQSLRPVHSGFNKYRLSLRSRVAGCTSLIADTEMINFVGKLISNNLVKPQRKVLKMPALIFDEKEKVASRFVSTNGLVEDPMAVEKERSLLNPWTEEEKAIFMDKLSACGKDFMKIASFFVHKTTADCIEFYYKNHKSEWFKRPVKVEKDSSTNNYLIASGKQLMPDGNTASLDILGSATVVTTSADNGIEIQQQCMSNYFLDTTASKISRDSCGLRERSDSPDLENSEKETLVADVLAGICGSLSLEALNSLCITSAIDLREAYYEPKYQEKCASSRLLSTTEVSQSFGVETCSGESLEDMDDADWTDAEKSIFIQGVSAYGKDFCMISRYMKTRSMDQCRLFFSKARKCASLDTICLGSGNTVSTDANAACRDTNGTSAVANLVAFSVKSGIKTERCLLSPRMILSRECDAAPMLNARPVLNNSEQSVGTSDLEPVDSKYHLDNLTEIQQVEKPEHTLGMDNMGHGIKMMDFHCGSTLVIPLHIEAVDIIGNANNLSDQSDCQSVEKLSSDLTGRLPDLSEINVNEYSEKDNTNPMYVSVVDHDTNLNQQVEKPEQALGMDGMGHGSNNMDLQSGSTLVIPLDLGAVDTDRHADHLSDQSDCESVEKPSSHLTGRELDLSETNVNEDKSSSDHHMELKMHSAQADDIASTSGCHDTAGSLQVELCSDSLEESCVISLKQNNNPVPVKLEPGVFVAAKCKKTSQEGTSSLAIDVKKNDDQDQVSRLGELYPSGHSLMDGSAACSKISEGHAVSVSTAREVNDDTSSKKLVTSPSISRYDRNFYLPPGGLLKKCNGTKENCSMSELPFQCVEQSRNCNPCSQSDASSGKDKPHQSGKFKLFGQTLRKPSLQQQRSVSVPQHKNSEIQYEAGKSSSVKLTADLSVGGSSALENSDSNNLLDSKPLAKFASCDGSRIQAGFPSLAGSVMPHSRYHQAFSSCLSSKMEHPRFHEINAGNWNLDGLSRFSARKICSSNRVMDYQVVRSREVRSFTVDMEQQPEVLFPKMMWNGLEVVSGVQNAERGTVGIKCGGNSSIVVGGQRSAFSDPLVARKMHYMQPNHSAFSDSASAMKMHYMQPKHSAFSEPPVTAMKMHYMQPKHSAFSDPVAAVKLHYMQPKHSAFSDPVAATKMHYMQPKHSSFTDPVAGTRMLYMQCKHSAFPDPVAAAKMQYMQRKQFNEQTMREDDFWTGQGNIGRLN